MSTAANLMPENYTVARQNMVDGQLRPNKITDERILTAMETVAREDFLPSPLAGIAYVDEDIYLGQGRYLMQPMIFGRLLQEGQIRATDNVLELAAGAGYSSVILSRLAAHVTSVDSAETLQRQAIACLQRYEVKNVEVVSAPLAAGYPAKAPYDVILINGSVDYVSDTLLGQLAEGGRLLAVVRTYGAARLSHSAHAYLYTKIGGLVSRRPLFDANLPLLTEFADKPRFEF